LSRHLYPQQAVKRKAALETKVTQGANQLKYMIKVIDNSKVLTMLTNSSTCQVAAHHCQNKMNGFLCPAFGIVFSPPVHPFPTMFGEDASRGT
jgi:hypothetical protein